MKTLQDATLAEIAQEIRNRFPKATSAKLFVNEQEHELSVSSRDALDGISMRSLDGEWIRPDTPTREAAGQ